MKISEFGGEQMLLKKIARSQKVFNKNVVEGIGDDAAVLELGGKLFVVTTDMLVEGDHFHFDWSSPKQVGVKAMESNVSDVAAMGALPKHAFVSLCLRRNATVELVEGLYKGIEIVARKWGIDVIGGDTTHGPNTVINVTLIGEVEKKNLKLRSNAKKGDLIFVSGDIGKSTAGLNLLLKDKKYLKSKKFGRTVKFHLQPKSRMDLIAGKKLPLRFVNAMEDVSDGLATEVKNICEMSKCGAVIYAEKVPIAKQTREAAVEVKKSALDFALFGGEDFELVFTVPKKHAGKFKGFHCVGEILEERKVFLEQKWKRKELKKKGFDHFK